MTKVITSPVKKFSGTVTLHDPLTFPQVIAFQSAIRDAQKLIHTDPESGEAVFVDGGDFIQFRYELLKGIIECVEKFDLANMPDVITAETFPSTPLVSSGKVVNWLRDELTKILVDDEDSPN